MRISRDKAAVSGIELTTEAVEPPPACRKRELAAVIQAALKVGADYSAREAGRRAFAELMKLDNDLQPGSALPMASAEAVIFAQPKRRRLRPAAALSA